MRTTDYQEDIKSLKKQVRILKRKLELSEADRIQLEEASEQRETLHKGLIRKLEASQTDLKKRSSELETALSNLKALQVKLIESEKMSALGVLVGGIAHEINNPINFIRGNVKHATDYFQDLLRLLALYSKYYPEPTAAIQQEIEVIDLEFVQEDLGDLLNSMYFGAERIGRIVTSLRTFSRLDEAPFKIVDIHEGIDSTLLLLKSRLQEDTEDAKNIKVIRDYGELPPIECYVSQLNQVFMNIINNSIDALNTVSSSPKLATSKTIWISTKIIDANYISIEITDNGTGIKEEEKNHIFEPFFTTKPIGKGTGLGLSISYQIITKQHGGTITCKSEQGKGTTFILKIPQKL